MKRFLVLLALCLPAPVWAQSGSGGSTTSTLAADYDLDGAAASTTAVHSADAITDDASFTIDAQPDTPRPLVVTLTDGDSSISACTYTLVGTTANGAAVTATATLTGGSGTKALSTAYNWASITSASVGTCTGEGGGDTVALGTSSTIPAVYVSTWANYKLNTLSQYERDFYNWKREERQATTSGASSTTVTSLSSSAAFEYVAVGDLLKFNVLGDQIERVVTAKASDDSITVDEALNIAATGVIFYYKKFLEGPDTEDSWLPVNRLGAATFTFLVQQLGNNIHVIVECRMLGAGHFPITVLDTEITAAGETVQAIDLRLAGYDQCRAGLQFSTSDADGDASTELEIITVQFMGQGSR